MTVEELGKKAILILGFGTEGQATYGYLRTKWPDKLLTIADRQTPGEFSEDVAYRIQSDPAVMLNFGPRYLDSLDAYQCEVVIKTPGIPATIEPIVRARKAGCIPTSHSQIFLSNYAKENITRFQTGDDLLIFNADYSVPAAIANRTKAQLMPLSVRSTPSPGCYLLGETIVRSSAGGVEDIMKASEIPLPGQFNVQNVLAAVAAASLLGVPSPVIREAVRTFQALPHRLEPAGIYNGITFYDDSIATVPDATLAALEALGHDVQTLILGGHERNLDFSEFGSRIPPNIKTVILFPPTGNRIWKAIETHSKNPILPEPFFVSDMEQAVKIAYQRTSQGGICLLSPASPSFGIFKDYRDRGDSFKALVRKLSNSS